MGDLTTLLPLQALVLEYRVAGALDGVTPSPPVVLPPGVAAGGGCRSIIEEVDNLGLINLTGFAAGPYADRIVRPMLILGPNVPIGGNNINVVFDGELSEVEHTIPAGANGIYIESCIYVPQGHQLQVQNMVASPGEPIVVRVGIFLSDTVSAHAQMREACCCLGSALNAAGEPANVTALYSAAACTRIIDSVAPGTISRALGMQAVTILGSGFAASDVVAIIHEDGTDALGILLVTFVDSGHLQVLVDVSTADLGLYDVTVAADLAFGTCSATVDGAIEITV